MIVKLGRLRSYLIKSRILGYERLLLEAIDDRRQDDALHTRHGGIG
jgi:hypothetical protein